MPNLLSKISGNPLRGIEFGTPVLWYSDDVHAAHYISLTRLCCSQVHKMQHEGRQAVRKAVHKSSHFELCRRKDVRPLRKHNIKAAILNFLSKKFMQCSTNASKDAAQTRHKHADKYAIYCNSVQLITVIVRKWLCRSGKLIQLARNREMSGQ